MTDHDLMGFITTTRRHLDAELAASTARPDLAASVARAREIDPDAVSAAAVREVAELPPIAQLRPRGAPVRENMSDKTALASFTNALRDQLDADLARQIHRAAISGPASATPTTATASTHTTATATLATSTATTATSTATPTTATNTTSTPAAPATVVPIAAPRSRRPLVALALALAAAVLLAVGLRSARQARQARQGAIPGAAALASLRAAASHAELRDPPRRAIDRPVPEAIKPVSEDIKPVPEDSTDVPDPKDSQPTDTSPPEPRPRPRKPTPMPTPAPTAELPTEDPLTALDREAQALWRSGDLRGATDKFTEIVQRAPTSRAAETAYGDLFALEHQLGGEPVALWRAYLRQFPRGRYADDARAGVCRREPTDTRAQCWTDYLADHPDGAHRREAEQAAP